MNMISKHDMETFDVDMYCVFVFDTGKKIGSCTVALLGSRWQPLVQSHQHWKIESVPSVSKKWNNYNGVIRCSSIVGWEHQAPALVILHLCFCTCSTLEFHDLLIVENRVSANLASIQIVTIFFFMSIPGHDQRHHTKLLSVWFVKANDHGFRRWFWQSIWRDLPQWCLWLQKKGVMKSEPVSNMLDFEPWHLAKKCD